MLAASAAVAASVAACRSTVPPQAPAPAPVIAAPFDSVRYPYTEADVRFMSAMIGHHAQAIVMSRMAPSHGANGSVQNLADRIVNAQGDEIRSMQRWLRDRGQTVPEPDTIGTGMPASGSGGHHHDMAMPGMAMGAALMPGMLTPPQLAQLDSARGAQFDRLFLRFMIQHHRGAVSMVRQLFSSYGAAQDETVFKFANEVSVDQTTEIARMERMLGESLFGPAAP